MDSARSLPKKFCAPFDPARMDSPLDRRRRRGSVEFMESDERPDEEADDAVEYDRWSSGMLLRLGVEEPIEVSIGVKMSLLLKGAIVFVEAKKCKLLSNWCCLTRTLTCNLLSHLVITVLDVVVIL